MLYTITEIQNYFNDYDYNIEVGNGHLAFFKDGVYVSIQTSDLNGTLEQMKIEVERRFNNGARYVATQTE